MIFGRHNGLMHCDKQETQRPYGCDKQCRAAVIYSMPSWARASSLGEHFKPERLGGFDIDDYSILVENPNRWIAEPRALQISSTNAPPWGPKQLLKSAITDGSRGRRLISELCRECRSVEALAPVRNAACDHEHRADMKIKQPTALH